MDEKKKMDEEIPVKRISGISFHKHHVKKKKITEFNDVRERNQRRQRNLISN